MKKRIAMAFLLLVVLLVSFGCKKGKNDGESEKLTVGMMSAVDSIPFYLALEREYFEQEKVDVELVLFTNAQHRQTALQTGQVDGAMTDLVALVTHSNTDFKLKGTLSTDGIFPLLINKEATENDRLAIGTMEISVTNYVLEKYLAGKKILEKVYINEIPARLEAILAGQLDGGIFPEPFASVGQLRGLEKLVFPEIPRQSLNIIAFTESAIKNKGSAIKKFSRAYARAISDLQERPELAFDTMAIFIPNYSNEIDSVVTLPIFNDPQLPDTLFIEEIINWTESVTKVAFPVDAESIVDRTFIEGL